MPSTTGTESLAKRVPSGKADRTAGAIHGVGPPSKPRTSCVARPDSESGIVTGAGTRELKSRVQ